jgi:rhomboid family GlyGly-CTERM serine protease
MRMPALRRHILAWGLAFAVVCAAAQGLHTAGMPLQFQRSVWAQGAWWQLFTAQWVHLGWVHGLGNVLAFVILWAMLRPRLSAHSLLLVHAGGLVGVAAVLLWDAQCQYYAGASGALHGLWAGAAVLLLLRGPRTWGAALMAVLALKLLLPWLWPGALPDPGFPVYHLAHVAGALGGLVAALALAGVQIQSPSRRQQGQ